MGAPISLDAVSVTSSIYSLNAAVQSRRLAQPQRSYMWRVVLPDITLDPAWGGYPSRARFFREQGYDPYQSATGLTQPSAMNLSSRVNSITVPFVTLETDKQNVGSSYWYYGKKNDIASIQMEILEYEDGATFQYLQGWQMMSTLPASAINGPNAGQVLEGTLNPPMFYKFPISLFRLDTKKLDLYVDQYTGFFLSGLSSSQSSYETSSFMTYSAQFTGDVQETRVIKANGGTIASIENTIMQETLAIAPQFTGISTGNVENLVNNLFQEIGSSL